MKSRDCRRHQRAHLRAPHPRVFAPPTGLSVAFDFLDRLMESPVARLLVAGPSFLPVFRKQAQGAAAAGNLAFDAQIAAICIETGALELVTADRDFARFDGLMLRPLEEPRRG